MFRSTVRSHETDEILGYIYEDNIGLCWTADTARAMDGWVSEVEELASDWEPGFYPVDDVAAALANGTACHRSDQYLPPTTVKRNGCRATIFETEDTGWAIRIGMNVYAGYGTRTDAVAAVERFI